MQEIPSFLSANILKYILWLGYGENIDYKLAFPVLLIKFVSIHTYSDNFQDQKVYYVSSFQDF